MPLTELATRYDPADFEGRWYAFWDSNAYFTPTGDPARKPYTIVIPPPNVTGRLHIGHALVNTLIDILTRWKRMCGYDALWLPGTDHAGIATQMVVEREIAKEGLTRIGMGREAFVERVWQWKNSHGDQIRQQLERLGASCDWTRDRFTLDDGLTRAVRHVFVRLHDENLIYRDLAMINWCPRCMTAISDIEVEYRDTTGTLYLIDYPVVESPERLTVATTRPETMLGDTGVAVHPDDDRYRHLVGRHVALPLTSRTIPIVADPILVDREFGTGVVKVTPAHDKNDYEAGHRNQLPQLQVIDEHGHMNMRAGEKFSGLDRFEARKRVVHALEQQGLLRETKQHMHAVAHCGKCGTVVEPMVSRQWFVRVAPLAAPALEAVRNGSVTITPQAWDATYYNWMENIHDWCISRQLWWGHRIPAWYCACGETVVRESAPEACPKCDSPSLTQDTDVLDTWFSSALWPFSTMGWPDATADLRRHYPTDTLVTGFDILFFWVARMIMMGLHFTGAPPFSRVFLNGLVRDEHGQKMSKSKGNVIDPLDVVDEFGADAVRFTLAIFASGRDIPLARNRMQGYAAFATKIWNASRFALMNVEQGLAASGELPREGLSLIDRWILSRLDTVTREVNRSLEAFRFDEASNALYQFFWRELCDWYIELVKPVLLGRHGDEAARACSRRVLLEVLDRSLRLLHPFMPFITEEIWQKLETGKPSIMIAPYPQADDSFADPAAEELVGTMQDVITLVRNLRAERGYRPSERFRVYVLEAPAAQRESLEANRALLMDLARLDELSFDAEAPAGAHRDRVGGVEIAIVLPVQTMPKEQIERLRKEITQLEKEIASVDSKLASEAFVSKAPAAIVEQTRERRTQLIARLEALRGNLGSEVS